MESKRAVEYAEKHRLWQKRLAEWKRGGLPQAEFCRRNNLDPRNFLYWKKKILPSLCTASLVELPAKLVTQSSLPASLPLCLVIDGRFRIEIAPGFDADTLYRLIGVLGTR